MYECELCKKSQYHLALNMFGYDIDDNKEIINHNIFICYHCARKIILNLVELSKQQKTNSIIPSLPWARRQRNEKITKDEVININLKIEKMFGIKDFFQEHKKDSK